MGEVGAVEARPGEIADGVVAGERAGDANDVLGEVLNRLLAAGGEAVCVIRLRLRHEPPCTASTRHLDRAMPGRNLFRPGSKPSDAAGNDESPGSRGFLRSG